MPRNAWRTEHMWCAMALGALDQLPNPDGWNIQVFAVADPARLPSAPNKAARKLRADLARMQQPVDEPLPTWLAHGMTLLKGTALPNLHTTTANAAGTTGDTDATGTATAGEPVPLLLAGSPAQTDPATALLGFRAAPPLLGLVAVVRGYVKWVEVTSPLGQAATQTARIWSTGGSQWPAEVTAAEAQPAVAAFAAPVGDGRGATLAFRVAAVGQTLPAGASQEWVDLDADGTLGFVAMLENPQLALEFACGREPQLGLEAAGTQFRPEWLVGRWWLHEVFLAVQSWRAAGDLDADIGVTEPPLEVGASWEAVRSDQAGDQRIGELLTGAEARLLPPLLLAAVTVSRTPAQTWLWDAIADQFDGVPDGTDTLRLIGEAWQQWPQLHEPDRFLGRSDSAHL